MIGGIIGSNNGSSPESMQYCYFLDTSAKKITDYGSTGTNCKSMTEEEMIPIIQDCLSKQKPYHCIKE